MLRRLCLLALPLLALLLCAGAADAQCSGAGCSLLSNRLSSRTTIRTRTVTQVAAPPVQVVAPPVFVIRTAPAVQTSSTTQTIQVRVRRR